MAYLWNETREDNRASVLTTRMGLIGLYRLKTTRTLVYKRLIIGPSFYGLPALRKFNIRSNLLSCFADGDQQTELNQTSPNGGQ